MKTNEFNKNGCTECKKIVYSGGNLPLIAENFKLHITLHQCPTCKTYWVYTEKYAKIIQLDDLKDDFPTEYGIINNS